MCFETMKSIKNFTESHCIIISFHMCIDTLEIFIMYCSAWLLGLVVAETPLNASAENGGVKNKTKIELCIQPFVNWTWASKDFWFLNCSSVYALTPQTRYTTFAILLGKIFKSVQESGAVQMFAILIHCEPSALVSKDSIFITGTVMLLVCLMALLSCFWIFWSALQCSPLTISSFFLASWRRTAMDHGLTTQTEYGETSCWQLTTCFFLPRWQYLHFACWMLGCDVNLRCSIKQYVQALLLQPERRELPCVGKKDACT